ncbi:MAG: aconitase family protein [Planctomycetaceae bacterium]
MDEETSGYLRVTGRTEAEVELVEAYYKAQGMFRTSESPEPKFSSVVELDLGSVQPSLAGPKRPQDRILLSDMKTSWVKDLRQTFHREGASPEVEVSENGITSKITDGAVVIAAITSCTNTSNPSVMIAAGLLARKAAEKGLSRKPWVKTSLAPGSRVVTDYLVRANLMPDLGKLGFDVVGYGCTTCIGNSGPLPAEVSSAVHEGDLVVSAVLSGNRNFEGRINQQVKANYLASPPLVVAYAIAGTTNIDLLNEPIGTDSAGKAVYLREIWPSNQEIAEAMAGEHVPRNLCSGVCKSDRWPGAVAANHRRGRGCMPGIPEHLRTGAPFFVSMPKTPAPIESIEDARCPLFVGGFGHHRPYQPGRSDQADLAGGTLSAGARGGDRRFQQLRFSPRE